MASTEAMQTQISELYVGLIGRAPDRDGLDFWVSGYSSRIEGGQPEGEALREVAQNMFDSDGAREYYPSELTNQQIVENFYENVLGRTGDSVGIEFWTGKLNQEDTSPGDVLVSMIDAVKNYSGTDADALKSQELFNDKVLVADYYVDEKSMTGADYSDGSDNYAAAEALLNAVSTSDITADNVAAFVSERVDGSDFTLTTSADDTFTGTDANDTYTATTDTLNNGDVITDVSSDDNDTLSITAGALETIVDTSGTTIRNVENVNVTFDSLNNSTLNASGIGAASDITVNQEREGSGATINVNSAGDDTTVTAGTDVHNLSVSTASADDSVTIDGGAAENLVEGTVSGEGDLDITANSAATVGSEAKSSTITAANASTINIEGVGSDDTASIAAAGNVSIDNGGNTNSVESLKLSGEAGAVGYTIETNGAEITLEGDENVTVGGDHQRFDQRDITSDEATGTTRLQITAIDADTDLSNADVDRVEISGALDNTVTLADEAVLEISANVTSQSSATIDIDDGDGANDIEGAASLFLSGDVKKLQVDSANDKITTLNVEATTAQSDLNLQAGSDTDVVLTGGSDVTLKNGDATAKSVDASGMTAALKATADGELLSITGGSGGDEITASTTSADLVVNGGAGNDTVTASAALEGTVDGGSGTDTLTTGGNDLSGATISNFEVINVSGDADVDASVVDEASIVIDGSNQLTLKGIGETTDLSGLAFNDNSASIVTDFATNKDAALGSGADITVVGSSNSDTIVAEDGGDVLDGGGGSDTITGGAGADTLTGGSGDDTFVYTAQDDIGSTDSAGDTITDFGLNGTTQTLQFEIFDSNDASSGFWSAMAGSQVNVLDTVGYSAGSVQSGASDLLTLSAATGGVDANALISAAALSSDGNAYFTGSLDDAITDFQGYLTSLQFSAGLSGTEDLLAFAKLDDGDDTYLAVAFVEAAGTGVESISASNIDIRTIKFDDDLDLQSSDIEFIAAG